MEKLSIRFGPSPEDVTVNGVSNALKTSFDFARHRTLVDDSLARYFRVNPNVIAQGRGDQNCIRLSKVDASGSVETKDYLDLVVAFGATGAGNGNPRIEERVTRYLSSGTPIVAGNVMHRLLVPTFTVLREISGIHDARIFSCNDSAVATSVAIRLALSHHARRRRRPSSAEDSRIVVMEGAYHGSADMARASLAGQREAATFGPIHTDLFLSAPFGDIGALEELFQKHRDSIAGLILEPVQGAAGCVAPPEGYLKAVGSLCRANGALLIVDEVKTGLGRCGEFVYSRAVGAEPDLICLGKSAGGGEFPLAFVVGPQDVMRGFEFTSYGVTHTATPPQCMAFLSFMAELAGDGLSGSGLLAEVQRKSLMLEKSLAWFSQRYPDYILGYDGVGLMRSIQTVFSGASLAAKLLEHGVYTTPIMHPDPRSTAKNRIYIAPALTIRYEQLAALELALAKAISELAASQ